MVVTATNAIAGIMAIGPLFLGMTGIMWVNWHFHHPVARRFMTLAVIIMVAVSAWLLLDYGVPNGIIDTTPSNVSTIAGCEV